MSIRTLSNAHLIRETYADIDRSYLEHYLQNLADRIERSES